MTMTFGRITLPAYQRMDINRTERGQVDRITGLLRADTLAESKVLRTELRGHQGDFIAITDTTDTDINGFYIVDSVRIGAQAKHASFQNAGLFSFTANVTYVGNYATTKLQSILARVSAVEAHATTPSYWWAPALDAQAVETGDASPTNIDRDGEDGTVVVSIDIDADCNPTWSIDPASYYDAAAKVYAGDVLRTGREIPMDVTDWYITNGLMELRPDAYQGTSSGELEVRFHDGTSWGSWQSFFINWAGTNKIPSWNYVTVLWNQPELVIVRLTRDAQEAPTSTTKLHELDISLRRGGRFVSCVYKFTGTAQTHAVEADGSDTATRPGGTASYSYLDTLVSGNRIVWGTPRAFTLSGRENQLNVASTSMPFWIGAAVDDAADATGNGKADLAEQFVGQSPERVRGVAR